MGVVRLIDPLYIVAIQLKTLIAEGTETVRLLLRQYLQSSVIKADQDDGIRHHSRTPTIQIQSVFIKTAAFFESPVLLKKDVDDFLAWNSNNESKGAESFTQEG